VSAILCLWIKKLHNIIRQPETKRRLVRCRYRTPCPLIFRHAAEKLGGCGLLSSGCERSVSVPAAAPAQIRVQSVLLFFLQLPDLRLTNALVLIVLPPFFLLARLKLMILTAFRPFNIIRVGEAL